MASIYKKIIFATAVAIAIVSLPACRDNGTPGGIENNIQQNMVTYLGDSLGLHLFSYRAYEDSPEMTLIAKEFYAQKDVPVGNRTVLQYYDVTENIQSLKRDISIVTRIPTISDTLRNISSQSLNNLVSNPIKLQSIWRTGKYININTFLQVTDTVRRIGLLVELPSTPGTDKRTVSATFIDDIMNGRGYFYRQAYLSFNTEDFWREHSGCDTLRVYVNDLSFPEVKYYSFTRPSENSLN